MKNKLKSLLFLICAFLFISSAATTTASAAAEYNTDLNPMIEFQCHVSNVGWMPWVGNGMRGGTTGKSLDMEAIKIQFTPQYKVSNVHIQYRVHVSNIGWLDHYSRNGEVAGTIGQARPMEAICIGVEN